jgi:hypothetical protein
MFVRVCKEPKKAKKKPAYKEAGGQMVDTIHTIIALKSHSFAVLLR